MIKLPFKPIILFTVPLLIFGCAGTKKLQVGETRLVESYGDGSYKTASIPDAFIGVSKDWGDESSARNDAELDARRKIVNSLEMRLSNDVMDRYLVQGETSEIIQGEVFQDMLTKAVAENILAVKPEGYYIEKYMKGASYGIDYYFNCWCKIKYSKAEHNRVVGRIVDEFVKMSLPALSKGRQYQSTGMIRDALRQYSAVNEWAEELEGYTGIDPALSSKVKNILYQARELLSGISVLVAVCDCRDGSKLNSTLFCSKLSEALSGESGFAVKSSLDWSGLNPDKLLTDKEIQLAVSKQHAADLLLVGKADVDELKSPAGNLHIARNRVHLKLVEGVTGNILWETTIDENNRGFGNNAETAIKRALSLSDHDSKNPFELISKEIIKSLK